MNHFNRIFSRPHPHVKHYHIKKNSRGEFYLSEKHCCSSIPDLINYHKHNSGGLASRLKTSPCDRQAPATAGLSHGMEKNIITELDDARHWYSMMLHLLPMALDFIAIGSI